MTSNPNSLSSTPPLPNAPILGYITRTNTPTRVRKTAARTLTLLGILCLIGSACATAFILLELWRDSRILRGGHAGRAVTLAWILHDLLQIAEDRSWIPPMLLILVPALILLPCSPAISRGKKSACFLAIFAIIPLICGLSFLATIFIAMALDWGLGLEKVAPQPLQLLWLLTFPPLLLLILLLKDLISYLLWIARNPITEKPPVRFLPA